MVVDWLYLVLPFFVCVFFSSRGSLTRGCVQGTDWEVSNSKKKGSPPSSTIRYYCMPAKVACCLSVGEVGKRCSRWS